MEVCKNVASLNILSDKLELSERAFSVVVVLQIGERNFKHATLETVRSDSCALSTINQGLANLAGCKHRWSFHIVPVFAGEGIDNLLFGSLLATFGQTFNFRKEKRGKLIKLHLIHIARRLINISQHFSVGKHEYKPDINLYFFRLPSS